MNTLLEKTGFWLARYLQKELPGYNAPTHTNPAHLKAALQPGDVLLVEGNLRVSVAIKYLTQSTWSHACFYAGPLPGGNNPDDPPCLVEADVVEGVIAVPLSKYAGQHVRICRPVNLRPEDRDRLVAFMTGKIGMVYDIKNAIDLLRYLFPQPPVPVRWRRRMLALGSGDPTRAICSTLLAQAFEEIHYPVLPVIKKFAVSDEDEQEIMHIRHHSLYTPRDFDISPYFRVVKPTLEAGFDYRAIAWGGDA